MAVKKIKWKELMTNVISALDDSDIEDDLEAIDTLVNEYLGEEAHITANYLASLFSYVKDDILTADSDGMWADIPVYISSYKEKDKRLIYLINAKLREYIGFYNKILTDEGVQRHLVYSKEYENDGNSDNIDRGINSNTPQNSNLYDSTHPESDSKFDQAIADYASEIDKKKSHSNSHTEGTSGTTVSGTTWDEGKKNIQMIFYNELKDYIFSIPERIYHHYSLETIPAPELVKRMIQHYCEVREMLDNE